VHVPKEQRIMWDPKSGQHILLGYCENTKGYRLVNPKNPGKTVKVRDDVLIETTTTTTTVTLRSI
jgi:hypothetical protein